MQERLEREHNLDLIMTAPTVIYQCRRTNGVVEEVSNPSALPDVAVRESISEPFVKMEVITPTEYNGQLMELCQQRRGARCRRATRSLFMMQRCGLTTSRSCWHGHSKPRAREVLLEALCEQRCGVCGRAFSVPASILRACDSPLQPQHCVPYSSRLDHRSYMACAWRRTPNIHRAVQASTRTCSSRSFPCLIDSRAVTHLTNCAAGEFLNMQYLTPERVTLSYEMPLAEVVTDFFDEMKSKSKGYASMEYQFIEHRVNDLVLMDIKINGEIAEPLATICHRCAAAAAAAADDAA